MPQLLFGGIIAVVLLALYVWAIISGTCEVYKSDTNPVEACKHVAPFTANVQSLLNSIGGLISAMVVGVLGSTQPTEFPGSRFFKKTLTGTTQMIAGFMPSVYILVWIICGTYMVIYGLFLYPDTHLGQDPAPAFNAQAKVWLGTAIASAYAYFGLKPNGPALPPAQPTPPSLPVNPPPAPNSGE